MKSLESYLSAFLLFLLLVEKSLGHGISPSLTKAILREIKGQTIDYIWDKTVDGIKQNSSPQDPNEPPKLIEGLSNIKVYLSNFGYLQSSASTFDDYLDKETMSAITAYQKYFKLQVTGDLSFETFKQILWPRCGVPDVNFNYEFTGEVSWPKSGNRWFPEGRNITYGFLPASKIPDTATKVFRDAFVRWETAAGALKLNLTETTTYDDADIKVRFYDFGDNVWNEVLGGAIIRLGSTASNTGEIRLDATKLWALPSEINQLSWQGGILDLESAAMHQIGHILGLDHSNMKDSVMYPYVLPDQQRKVELSDSDKNNIQHQYSNANSRHAGRWGLLLVAMQLTLLDFLMH